VLNAAKMWTCLPMLVAMLLPVVEAKYFLDDAGAERDWLVDPYGTVWFTALYAGYVGIFEEVLAAGRGEIGKKVLTPLDEAALGVVVGGFCVSAAMRGLADGSEDAGTWQLLCLVSLVCASALFKVLDRRDEGRRLGLFATLTGQWFFGAGLSLGAEAFVRRD